MKSKAEYYNIYIAGLSQKLIIVLVFLVPQPSISANNISYLARTKWGVEKIVSLINR
jgi:hypothetical protein